MHRSKIQREQTPQTYYVLLNNGEQHFIQADTASEAASSRSNCSVFDSSQQQFFGHPQQQQQQHQQPHIHPDTFLDVIDYVEHLYADLANEKHLTQYFCLFCASEYDHMRLLIRHLTDVHRPKILDGTLSLGQDFREIVRNKIISAEQNRTVINTDSQLYQCGQCQHMFHSLDLIAEHFTRCPGSPNRTATPQQMVEPIKVEPSEMVMSPQIKTESMIQRQQEDLSTLSAIDVNQNQYVPYGCARCGRRWYTIYELSQHIVLCQDDIFYNSAKHLLPEHWVEAPRNQHIVINEDSTNVTLKTTGLWLMPEPNESSESRDALRGFWVMPSYTTIYQDHNQQQLQQQQQQQQQQQKQQPETKSPVITNEQDGNYIENLNSGNLWSTAVAENPNEGTLSNATTVITHTSPAIAESLACVPNKRRRTPKLQAEYPGSTMTNSANKRKRTVTKRGSRTASNNKSIPLIAEELPPEQRYYMTYDENGALVPMQNSQNITGTPSSIQSNAKVAPGIEILNVVDIKNESYSYSEDNILRTNIQSINTSTETNLISTSMLTPGSTKTNGSASDFNGYDIDDLSHLDKPLINSEEAPAIKPLQTKPQFVDSFFSFLMSRDTNKS